MVRTKSGVVTVAASSVGSVAVSVGFTGPAGSAAFYAACPGAGADHCRTPFHVTTVGGTPSLAVDIVVCSATCF